MRNVRSQRQFTKSALGSAGYICGAGGAGKPPAEFVIFWYTTMSTGLMAYVPTGNVWYWFHMTGVAAYCTSVRQLIGSMAGSTALPSGKSFMATNIRPGCATL